MEWHHTASHRSLYMLVSFFPSFLRLGITLACIWNFAKIILGCINYFHNYVSKFMKKIPFSRPVESWHAYPYTSSTCRQVKISFLSMPQIAHFQVVGGGTPPSHTLPQLGRYAPSQRLCPPPQMFWLITPLKASALSALREGVRWELCCVPKYDGVEKVLNFENDIASLK